MAVQAEMASESLESMKSTRAEQSVKREVACTVFSMWQREKHHLSDQLHACSPVESKSSSHHQVWGFPESQCR
jgi:hypothetical protein